MTAKKAMLMLSGGLDSTVMAYHLKKEGYQLYGVHINAGQPHFLQDRRAVNLLSMDLGIPVQIIDVPKLVDSFKGYLQTDFEIQHQVFCETSRPFIAALSLAGVYADITGFDNLYIAYLKEELEEFKSRYANLKDVHVNFEKMINVGRNKNFRIETPFMEKSKSDVVALGVKLGVPMDTTWSCWNNHVVHCGHCKGCGGRKTAFLSTNTTDEIKYLT